MATLIYKRSLKLLRTIGCRLQSNRTQEAPKALRSLKAKSSSSSVQFYVDTCRLRAEGGSGGDGCISFLHAFCKENAGPNGGDGGHGGHVILQATTQVKSLNRCKPVVRAAAGENGQTKDCCGKNANHMIIPVPVGTLVRNENMEMVADLDKDGMMYVAARGGSGGRGNHYFVTAVVQAPTVAEFGAPGEQFRYLLEVRSMAHVGLIGFPNAGKSTLLRAISRARPAVAPYPFTTLRPHVGIVPYDDYEQVAVADLPGLIVGSHRNRGLGIQFLQHAQRCLGLVFVLDASQDKPWLQYKQLRHELEQFDPELVDRPCCVVANKMDLPEAKRHLPALRGYMRARNVPHVVPLSAKHGTELGPLLRLLRDMRDGLVQHCSQDDVRAKTSN